LLDFAGNFAVVLPDAVDVVFDGGRKAVHEQGEHITALRPEIEELNERQGQPGGR